MEAIRSYFELEKHGTTVRTEVRVGIAAFLTIAMMPLTFSIANGIAAGIFSFTIIKLLSGEGRSVRPMMYFISLILVVYYAFVH